MYMLPSYAAYAQRAQPPAQIFPLLSDIIHKTSLCATPFTDENRTFSAYFAAFAEISVFSSIHTG
jgi:hypothetical protein